MTVQQRVVTISDLGPLNPLPMLGAAAQSRHSIGGDLPREIREGAAYGYPANLYPYRLQDGYGRERSERALPSVVLENERLRAVFLPTLGGRLWELLDKRTGKNLVYTPSSIQFGNLALRNAWFAGGIEWNIGTRGHSPTTCSTVHSGILTTPGGQEVLRMWEFERLREVVFQIDAWLPPGSPVLYAAVRVRNPNDADVPMYWWSNAAVPEAADSRVLAPADSAFATDYAHGIARVDPTGNDGRDGVDGTWPTNNERARDFFFDIPAGERPWILNTDADGDGLAMLSTAELRGRKLFVWGQGVGGRRWQRWLSPEGGRYAEIQAGLAQTQVQHLVMPARAEWSWLEAYGNAGADPALAHGDWPSAVCHGRARVRALADERTLQNARQAARGWVDRPPQRMVTTGSGWGALESARRRRHGMPWLDESGTPFVHSSIGAPERPWLDLLDGRGFDGADTFVKGADWERLLQQAEPTAATLLHRAVLAHARGAAADARRLYDAVLASAEHPPESAALAHRGLALLDLGEAHEADAADAARGGQPARGLAHYEAACTLHPRSTALLLEAVGAFLAGDRPRQALDLLLHRLGEAGAAGCGSGRIRFLEAVALARAGRTAEAAAVLDAGVEVADIREGETSLGELWRQVHPGEDVPPEYEFGMG